MRTTIKQQAATARDFGQVTFIADRPCPRGHLERYASNGLCVRCQNASQQFQVISGRARSRAAKTYAMRRL
jgi:hypothetical protein